MYADKFDDVQARAQKMNTVAFREEHQVRWARHLQETINALVKEITSQDVKGMLDAQPLIPGGSEMLLWSSTAAKYGEPMADGEYRTVGAHSTSMVCLGPPLRGEPKASRDEWFDSRRITSLRRQLTDVFAPFDVKIRTARGRVEVYLSW